MAWTQFNHGAALSKLGSWYNPTVASFWPCSSQDHAGPLQASKYIQTWLKGASGHLEILWWAPLVDSIIYGFWYQGGGASENGFPADTESQPVTLRLTLNSTHSDSWYNTWLIGAIFISLMHWSSSIHPQLGTNYNLFFFSFAQAFGSSYIPKKIFQRCLLSYFCSNYFCGKE